MGSLTHGSLPGLRSHQDTDRRTHLARQRPSGRGSPGVPTAASETGARKCQLEAHREPPHEGSTYGDVVRTSSRRDFTATIRGADARCHRTRNLRSGGQCGSDRELAPTGTPVTHRAFRVLLVHFNTGPSEDTWADMEGMG